MGKLKQNQINDINNDSTVCVICSKGHSPKVYMQGGKVEEDKVTILFDGVVHKSCAEPIIEKANGR